MQLDIPYMENDSFFETKSSNNINTEHFLQDFIDIPFKYKNSFSDLEYINPSNFNPEKLMDTKDKRPNKSKNLFSTFIQQKRGRKNKNNDKSAKIHGKYDEDNITRKIQVHYINFIVNFINEILIRINRKDSLFIPLNYFYKRIVSKNYRESLKKKTIKEVIINNNISHKYSIEKKNLNILLYEKIKKENIYILLNILNKEFFFFFDKIYYKNCRNFNLKQFGFEDIDIQLSNKIELFGDLLIKNKTDIHFEEYKIKLKNCAKKYFLPERNEIFKCNY